MVSPYLNRPLRSLDEVLRTRGERPQAVPRETPAREAVPAQASAGSRRGPETAPMRGETTPLRGEAAALPARREAA